MGMEAVEAARRPVGEIPHSHTPGIGEMNLRIRILVLSLIVVVALRIKRGQPIESREPVLGREPIEFEFEHNKQRQP